MRINPFCKTTELNELDLANNPGIRFYYSKVKNWISIAIITLPLGFMIALMFLLTEFYFTILFVILSLILVSIQISHLCNILLKNPIFILDNTKLYYIHHNQWYDLNMHSFENEIFSKNNYYLTFCVRDENGKKLFSENNWVLNDEDRFYKAVRYLKSNYPYEGKLKQ
ncbi:MAG: hypothetical protein PHQ74_11555 [Crocinitomicaceae bacterium]|nr:hypothetical protein [Crocinitomicaceae bacterium]